MISIGFLGAFTCSKKSPVLLRGAIRLRACMEEARELDLIFLRDSQIPQAIPIPLPAGLAMVTFPDDPGQDLEEIKLVPIVEEDLNLKLAPNSHVLDRMNEQARLTHILDETSMRSITGLPVPVGELDWDSRTLPSLHRIVSIFHGTPYLEASDRASGSITYHLKDGELIISKPCANLKSLISMT